MRELRRLEPQRRRSIEELSVGLAIVLLAFASGLLYARAVGARPFCSWLRSACWPCRSALGCVLTVIPPAA